MSTLLQDYKLICGMETHAELKTDSKMFCGCKNDPFGAPEPNMYTCPVCLGLPGALPVPNKKAIEWTIKIGLALNCKINLLSKFDRKHYFYPDLAKGFQLSQYDLPFCYDGYIDTSEGRVRIRRIHLEEDTGKLQHTEVDGKQVSLVDFNRSGVPLVEIVTEPDIKTPSQAKEYGRKLRELLRFLQVADCDMEQGGMRLEANISLANKSAEKLPDYKVEVKNINSFRFVEQAITFEMDRQAKLLSEDKTPAQETRGFNPNNASTFSQRTKEEAADYRYFPEPDTPPIQLEQSVVDEIEASIGELPDQLLEKWKSEYKIKKRFGEQLIQDYENIDFYKALFAETVSLEIATDQLASDIVNKKFIIKSRESAQVKAILEKYKAATSTDDIQTAELEAVIQNVIAENEDEANRYAAGETKLLNFFIGQTMRQLKKKIDVSQIKPVLDKLTQK